MFQQFKGEKGVKGIEVIPKKIQPYFEILTKTKKSSNNIIQGKLFRCLIAVSMGMGKLERSLKIYVRQLNVLIV